MDSPAPSVSFGFVNQVRLGMSDWCNTGLHPVHLCPPELGLLAHSWQPLRLSWHDSHILVNLKEHGEPLSLKTGEDIRTIWAQKTSKPQNRDLNTQNRDLTSKTAT